MKDPAAPPCPAVPRPPNHPYARSGRGLRWPPGRIRLADRGPLLSTVRSPGAPPESPRCPPPSTGATGGGRVRWLADIALDAVLADNDADPLPHASRPPPAVGVRNHQRGRLPEAALRRASSSRRSLASLSPAATQPSSLPARRFCRLSQPMHLRRMQRCAIIAVRCHAAVRPSLGIHSLMWTLLAAAYGSAPYDSPSGVTMGTRQRV